MGTVLITGANRGIGLELSRLEKADVTDAAALEAVSRDLGDTKIDVLINNAGVFTYEAFQDLDFEQLRTSFEVNALGALRVTSVMQHHLGRGSKIILITSRMGSIGDNGSGGYYGYRMAKAALNMAGVNLAHDFRSKGIAVAILHPGMVATEMTGHQGIPVAESAEGLLARIDALQLQDSGSFWHANGERLPW
jgi:NAD(P)-dependent dehydrogenase (short-subunit alcohol dehydrogenase family)